MARWMRLTHADGADIFVNIELAMWVRGNNAGGSTIAFAGGEDDVVRVKEYPNKILDGSAVYAANSATSSTSSS